MSIHRLTMGAPGALTSRSFFELACRAAIGRYAGQGSGRFTFLLSGARGGTWTLDLDACQVTAGPLRDPGISLELSADDFLAWLQNRFNVVEAYMTGRLIVRGPIERLKILAAFMKFANRKQEEAPLHETSA